MPCTDVDTCCAACEANPRCGAYTLNRGTNTCWLRTSARPAEKGDCLSGTVRPPPPPTPPPPPLPPQPPHPGIVFSAPQPVPFPSSNAASFYGIPCGNQTCIFGDSATVVYQPWIGWRVMPQPRMQGASFTMPAINIGYLETVGNLTNSAVDGDTFVGDDKAGLLRFHANGALIWSLLGHGKRMTYTGLPCRAYKFRVNSGGTVRMADGSLLQTVNYKCYNDSLVSSAGDVAADGEEPLSPGHSTLGLYRSTDGVFWEFFSTVVSWHQTVGSDGTPDDEGPNENDIVNLPGRPGSLFVVVRGDSGDGVPRHLLRPYWSLFSSDGGVSWSQPRSMTATDGSAMGSARPRLLLLGKNGTGPLVLTGGRPGLYLWINEAADGIEWQKINLAAAHNAAIAPGGGSSAPSFRFCDAFVNASLATQDKRQGIATLCASIDSHNVSR